MSASAPVDHDPVDHDHAAGGDEPAAPRSRNPLTWLLTALVDLYRLTAPLRQPRCRFYPSCSTYARTALLTHGPVRGLYLSVRRLLRCHPWNPGGVDHVPPKA